MNKVRITQDQFDRDIMHIYIEYFFTFTSKKESRWLHASSMHSDMVDSMFGPEVSQKAENDGDTEVLIATHLKEEVD